jgi:hypothetical protein
MCLSRRFNMLLHCDTHSFHCIFRCIEDRHLDVRTSEEAMRVLEVLTEVNTEPSETAFLLHNIYKLSSYLTRNTLRLHYKAQPVNVVWGNSRCLLWEPYGTHRYTVWAECRDCTTPETHYDSTTKPNRLMLFGETVAVYCENRTEHTDTLCGQNVEFVPHRKHITSPLQSSTG